MGEAQRDHFLLAINAGSSSLKFAVFRQTDLVQTAGGAVNRIGQSDSRLTIDGGDIGPVPSATHAEAVEHALAWIDRTFGIGSLVAIGHRIVHGGAAYREHCVVDDAVIAELERIVDYAPEHLPSEIAIVSLCRARFPNVPQIACFDTVFHRDMPLVARQLSIPRRFAEVGIERYGFHGLSCSYVLEVLNRLDPDRARGRVVLAHIGNGASLTAVRAGRSIDTTMGFTPAAGVPMGTRSGDIDPGLVRYLTKTERLDADAFDHLVNHQSGLLGMSEISADVRILLDAETQDRRAAEALGVYCYRIRQAIGALAASLGGLDALVFTGGVGENAAVIRERVCAELEFLGIALDPTRNQANAITISTDTARVGVHVIPTDEEAVIAAAVIRLLKQETFAS